MRLKLYELALVLAVIAALLGIVGAPRLVAQDTPMFIPGQRYLVVWDCAPEYLAQVVSTSVAGGQILNLCYTEELTAVHVWSNGWLTVRDNRGGSWVVNPARAIGYQAIGGVRTGP